MNDTAPKVELMVRERYKQMTPDERVRIAASMFDAARAIVLSSLPADLSPRDRRLAVARRFYAGELPEAALIAHAEWSPDSDNLDCEFPEKNR
ncbi:MAG TPA: hypothetical protein VFG91_14390 [Woeseiaceae bacterium]|nr:hypothetical protein [Woeseiaceae bacterium]